MYKDHPELKEFDKNFYEYILANEIESDNTSISSKSTTKSSLADEIILCGASLKKKGETCRNKANPECNGRCKKHYVKENDSK
jgi:hypothetical protein